MSPDRTTSKMFPIREKNPFYCFPNGDRVVDTPSYGKNFLRSFPCDKYENQKKCICRPIAEHVFSCNHFIFFQIRAFLLGYACWFKVVEFSTAGIGWRKHQNLFSVRPMSRRVEKTRKGHLYESSVADQREIHEPGHHGNSAGRSPLLND